MSICGICQSKLNLCHSNCAQCFRKVHPYFPCAMQFGSSNLSIFCKKCWFADEHEEMAVFNFDLCEKILSSLNQTQGNHVNEIKQNEAGINESWCLLKEEFPDDNEESLCSKLRALLFVPSEIRDRLSRYFENSFGTEIKAKFEIGECIATLRTIENCCQQGRNENETSEMLEKIKTLRECIDSLQNVDEFSKKAKEFPSNDSIYECINTLRSVERNFNDSIILHTDMDALEISKRFEDSIQALKKIKSSCFPSDNVKQEYLKVIEESIAKLKTIKDEATMYDLDVTEVSTFNIDECIQQFEGINELFHSNYRSQVEIQGFSSRLAKLKETIKDMVNYYSQSKKGSEFLESFNECIEKLSKFNDLPIERLLDVNLQDQGVTSNPGYNEWCASLIKTSINLSCLNKIAATFIPQRIEKKDLKKVVFALRCLDLTSLSGDDTGSNVRRMCYTAVNPIKANVKDALKCAVPLEVAAVCVYPNLVEDAHQSLNLFKATSVKLASVASGFPSGQYCLNSKIREINDAVKCGATEIDIVLSRRLPLEKDWKAMYKEIRACRAACGRNVIMKTIISIGELGSMENVYAASFVALCAGSDFIKTSTGIEYVNATLPAGIVIARAIKDYYDLTKFKAGLKPSGSLYTTSHAFSWINLVNDILGKEWLTPKLFRIGGNTVLNDITQTLELLV